MDARLGAIDVEESATALADQSDYEHRWLLDPRTGRVQTLRRSGSPILQRAQGEVVALTVERSYRSALPTGSGSRLRGYFDTSTEGVAALVESELSCFKEPPRLLEQAGRLGH